MKSDDLYVMMLDDYGYEIDRWNKVYDKYCDTIKLKSLSKLSTKQIRDKLRFRYTDDGQVIISSSHKIYDLASYYGDPESYYFDLMNLMRGLKHDITNKEEAHVNFRFVSGEISRMSTIHFLFNMMMWYPLFILTARITPDKVIKTKVFDSKVYEKYINEQIVEPYKHLVTFNQMSSMLSRIYDFAIRVSEMCGIYLGLSFSVYDIIHRWDQNEELKEINHTRIPDGMSIKEAEQMFDSKAVRLQEIVMNELPNSQLAPLMRAKQLNRKQIKEFAVNIGFKPDNSGKTLNTRPTANFINEGLRNPVDYVTDATGGRKASILALEIDTAGYLQRTLCKCAANVKLHEDPEYDCGSTHYCERHIQSENDLRDLRGRWYLDEENNILRQLIETDYHLIGKVIKYRSPATCASKHGICATCYGHLYNQNYGINVGINSALILSQFFYQRLMSAKHVLNFWSLKWKLLRVYRD